MGRNVNKTNTQQITRALAGFTGNVGDLCTITGNGRVYKTSRSGADVLDSVNTSSANLPAAAGEILYGQNRSYYSNLDLGDFYASRRASGDVTYDTIGVYGYDGSTRVEISGAQSAVESYMFKVGPTKFVETAQGKLYDYSTHSSFANPVTLTFAGSTAYKSGAELTNGNFVMAGNYSSGGYWLRFYIYNSAGAVVTGPVDVVNVAGNQFDRIEVLGLSTGGFAILYIQAGDGNLRMRQFDSAGVQVGGVWTKSNSCLVHPAASYGCHYLHMVETADCVMVQSNAFDTNVNTTLSWIKKSDNTVHSELNLNPSSGGYGSYVNTCIQSKDNAWLFYRRSGTNNVLAYKLDPEGKKIGRSCQFQCAQAVTGTPTFFTITDLGIVAVNDASGYRIELFTEGGRKVGLTVMPFTPNGSPSFGGSMTTNGKQVFMRLCDSGQPDKASNRTYHITQASVLGVALTAPVNGSTVQIARVGAYQLNEQYAGCLVSSKSNTIAGSDAHISATHVVLTR